MFKLDILNDLQQNVKIGMKQNMYVTHGDAWFEEKTKTEYTIWSIARGNIYIKIAEKEYAASAGDAVLFCPGIRYIAHSDENGCEFLFQQFSLELGNDINLLAEFNLAGIVRGNHIIADHLNYYSKAKNLKYIILENSLGVYAEFFCYISKIIELIDNGRNEPFFEDAAHSLRSEFWKAISYISEHFSDHISIKEIAQNAGFSEKYFIQQFKRTLGLPPKQYFVQCRMRYAAHRLLHSNDKIQEIAEYLGYADIYSFSKAFKKYYDESPTEFRKNYIY